MPLFNKLLLRVFAASSKEALSEMLGRQNNYLVSSSVTASQFLLVRNIARGEQALNASDQRVPTQTDLNAQESVALATWKMHKAAQKMQHQEADTATLAKEVWEKHQALQGNQQEVGGVIASPLHDHLITMGILSSLGLSLHN